MDEPGVTAALVCEELGISWIGSEIHGSPIDYEEANLKRWSRYGVASRAGTSSGQHRKEAEHDECRDECALQESQRVDQVRRDIGLNHANRIATKYAMVMARPILIASLALVDKGTIRVTGHLRGHYYTPPTLRRWGPRRNRTLRTTTLPTVLV